MRVQFALCFIWIFASTSEGTFPSGKVHTQLTPPSCIMSSVFRDVPPQENPKGDSVKDSSDLDWDWLDTNIEDCMRSLNSLVCEA